MLGYDGVTLKKIGAGRAAKNKTMHAAPGIRGNYVLSDLEFDQPRYSTLQAIAIKLVSL